MNWALGGLVYAAVYAAAVAALGGQPHARVLAGNVALLLPPLAPLAVIARRRLEWKGRQQVFFGAIAAWGSRYPHHDASAPDEAIANLRKWNVPDTVMASYMGGNAARHFGLAA